MEITVENIINKKPIRIVHCGECKHFYKAGPGMIPSVIMALMTGDTKVDPYRCYAPGNIEIRHDFEEETKKFILAPYVRNKENNCPFFKRPFSLLNLFRRDR